jgi:heat shock protein HtpX
MSEAPGPALVYDRIEENRRRTRRLVILFVLFLFPFALALVPFACHLATVSTLAVWGGGESFSPGRFYAVAITFLTIAACAGVVFIWSTFHNATRRVLRMAGATRISSTDEPELWRVVENLSIGAGLPMPAVYVTESRAPNAFAAGLERDRAAIVVSRGLLRLLDRRELQGVVAHELSHIGNADIRLNTVLAAFVALLRLPFTLAFRMGPTVGAIVLGLSVIGFGFALLASVGYAVNTVLFALMLVRDPALWDTYRAQVVADPRPLIFFVSMVIYGLIFVGGPFYLLVGGRVLGLVTVRAVARERELQADADAYLLTRDAESLATALAKLDAASRGRDWPAVSPAVAHLLVIAPSSRRARWWEGVLRTHPPVEQRIETLARMSGGIPPETIARAREEAACFAASPAVLQTEPHTERKPQIRAGAWTGGESPIGNPDPAPVSQVIRPNVTPVYEKPDGWSKVLCQLPKHAVVTVCGIEGNFLKVTTADRVVGYIAQSARGHVIATTRN